MANYPSGWGIKILPMSKNQNNNYLDYHLIKNFSVKHGMPKGKIENFVSRLRTQMNLNAIKISSSRLKYVPDSNYFRMIYFLIASHGMINLNKLKSKLNNDESFSGIFPLVLGQITTENEGAKLRPFNLTEPPLINTVSPRKKLPLDEFSYEFIRFADGSRSFNEILGLIQKRKFKHLDNNKKDVSKMAKDIFGKLLRQKTAIGFGLRWE
jgi:hypothetical protein